MGRAELERAFTRLGDRLVRRGVVADIFVVGGAAMAPATPSADSRLSSSSRNSLTVQKSAPLSGRCVELPMPSWS
jgi:hypothetical protein